MWIIFNTSIANFTANNYVNTLDKLHMQRYLNCIFPFALFFYCIKRFNAWTGIKVVKRKSATWINDYENRNEWKIVATFSVSLTLRYSKINVDLCNKNIYSARLSCLSVLKSKKKIYFMTYNFKLSTYLKGTFSFFPQYYCCCCCTFFVML